MDIVCERCSAAIPAADVDLGTGLARCQGCNAVFDVRAQVERGSRALAQRKAYLLVPPAIRVVEEGGGALAEGNYRAAPGTGRLVLARRWASKSNTFLAIFVSLWSVGGFALFTATCMKPKPLGADALGQFMFAVMSLPLLYVAAAGVLNETWIAVSSEVLSIKHAPVPWPGARTLRSAEVKALRYEELVNTGKGPSKSYTVWAVLQGGETVPLLKWLLSLNEAHFIVERVDQHLARLRARRGADSSQGEP